MGVRYDFVGVGWWGSQCNFPCWLCTGREIQTDRERQTDRHTYAPSDTRVRACVRAGGRVIVRVRVWMDGWTDTCVHKMRASACIHARVPAYQWSPDLTSQHHLLIVSLSRLLQKYVTDTERERKRASSPRSSPAGARHPKVLRGFHKTPDPGMAARLHSLRARDSA